jgi:hypothetical protein
VLAARDSTALARTLQIVPNLDLCRLFLPCKNTQKNNSLVHQQCPTGKRESSTKRQEHEIFGEYFWIKNTYTDSCLSWPALHKNMVMS